MFFLFYWTVRATKIFEEAAESTKAVEEAAEITKAAEEAVEITKAAKRSESSSATPKAKAGPQEKESSWAKLHILEENQVESGECVSL